MILLAHAICRPNTVMVHLGHTASAKFAMGRSRRFVGLAVAAIALNWDLASIVLWIYVGCLLVGGLMVKKRSQKGETGSDS